MPKFFVRVINWNFLGLAVFENVLRKSFKNIQKFLIFCVVWGYP